MQFKLPMFYELRAILFKAKILLLKFYRALVAFELSKKLSTVIVIILITNSSLASEKNKKLQSLQTDFMSMSADLSKENKLSYGLKHLGRGAKWTAAELAHTLLFISLVTGLNMTINLSGQHLKNGTTPSADDLKQYADIAFDEIFNSGELWVSAISATFVKANLVGGVKLASSYSENLRKILLNSNDRALFKGLFTNLLSSVIIFVGWEFGKNWWKASLAMLSDEDYAVAKRIIGSKDSLVIFDDFGGDFLKLSRDREGSAIFVKIFANMFEILFLNPSLRERVLHNTWRLSIATSDFVSMVGLASVGGFLGSYLVKKRPNAGSLLGAIFGLLIYSFIPQKYQTLVTSQIKIWQSKLKNNIEYINNAIKICEMKKLTDKSLRESCYQVAFINLSKMREKNTMSLWEGILILENSRRRIEFLENGSRDDVSNLILKRNHLFNLILENYQEQLALLESVDFKSIEIEKQKNNINKIIYELKNKFFYFSNSISSENSTASEFFINLVYDMSYERQILDAD